MGSKEELETTAWRETEEELRRLIRINKVFLSIINHEMRTPLTAIIGYTDLLLDKALVSADAQEMVESIRRNSERLLALVNDILDISRLENGRLLIVRQNLDIRSVVDQTLAAIRSLADNKHIAIRANIPPGLPDVYGDPTRVGQILTNLLSNAVKYTPDWGKVTIEARKQDDADMIEVSIRDDGIGIPSDQLGTVFDRFHRVERAETRNTIGTGLGLFITKGLVEAHDGEIWVESEEGQGSCFYFTLPMTPRRAARSDAANRSKAV